MRPHGTAVQLEQRRRRAIELLQAGLNLPAVAVPLKASVSSVGRWERLYKAHGWEGLRPVPTPGRPPKMSPAQKRQLVRVLLRGPTAAGYPTELWTLRRVADLIERRFGVHYHPAHVWKVLRALGWSCQKPERRAQERDERAIQRWRRRRWPHIKKRPTPGA